MKRFAIGSVASRFSALCLVAACIASPALGADMVTKAPALTPPATVIDTWTYRFTPYAWLPGVNGSSTVKGMTTDIDLSFIDIVEHAQIPKDLFALMGYFEARNGRLSLFGDAIYMLVGMNGGAGKTLRPGPFVNATINAQVGVKFQMAIAEAGAAYEIAHWGGGMAGPASNASFTALDLTAGGRFWWQKADVNLAVTAALQVLDLTVAGGRAAASSGSVDWADPFVGVRLRHQFAPGKELTLTGDIGGFGVGSKFSWQAVGAYSWEITKTSNVTWAGLIGYRALYVDYAQGSGRSLYAYDILEHGPILGVSMRF